MVRTYCFYEIKKLKFKRITFDFQVVLFDVDKSRIEEMVNLKKNNRMEGI